MNIRIEGTKEELEKVIEFIHFTGIEDIQISRPYPNKGNSLYRIYLNQEHHNKIQKK